MNRAQKITILCIALAVLLVACSKAQCKQDSDCTEKSKTAYTSRCLSANNSCEYQPIPGVCGNGNCNEANKNKCTCPQDCGTCSGKVSGSTLLTQQCVQNTCIQGLASSAPLFSSQDIQSLGDKFKIDTLYRQPFNLKNDTFGITITLGQQSAQNRDEHLLRAELSAVTTDHRTITLARKDIDKYLWSSGSSIDEDLILDFPTQQLEGDLNNMILSIDYEYSLLQGTKKTLRQASFKIPYKEKFTFAKPNSTYACPACTDRKGYRKTCGPQTNYFCKYDPVLGACGNSKCETGENKCTCPQDCGPCQGSAGTFLDFTCKEQQCATVLKPDATITPNNILDQQNLGLIQLANNYKFNNPLAPATDKLDLSFAIYKIDPGVSAVTIETIRILDGQQQLAEVPVNKILGQNPTTIDVTLPAPTQSEEDHSLTLAVWYSYVQNEQTKKANFQKPLGRITLLNTQ